MAQSLAEVTTANGRKGSVDLDALNQAADETETTIIPMIAEQAVITKRLVETDQDEQVVLRAEEALSSGWYRGRLTPRMTRPKTKCGWISVLLAIERSQSNGNEYCSAV
jgi:hypothetical protein